LREFSAEQCISTHRRNVGEFPADWVRWKNVSSSSSSGYHVSHMWKICVGKLETWTYKWKSGLLLKS